MSDSQFVVDLLQSLALVALCLSQLFSRRR